MNNVRRFDIGSLKAPQRMPNGWLRADGYLTRTGVFVYRNPDGTERRELRLPDEVFRGDSLASFGLVPVTDDHPAELLTAENTKAHAVGAVSETVRRDGDMVRASLLVTDAKTIAKMEQGKVQLSCGYTCDLEPKAGEWNGHRYDAIQRNIRGNHVAIVEVGRAGPDAKLRMDATDGVMLGSEPAIATEPQEHIMKIRIDGVEYEVTEQVAQAIEKERNDVAERAAAAAKTGATVIAERDSLKAKLDSATEELAKATAARKDAEDPAKLAALVASRVALEVEARKHLGVDVKLDGMTDRAIKVAVVEKVTAAKLDAAQSDAYVAGRFDAAIERAAKENPALAAARAAASNMDAASPFEQPEDEKAKREKMMKENRDAWKKPIQGGMSKQ